MRIASPFSRALLETGFQAHESMEGLHEFVARQGPAGAFPFSFELDWGCERLASFLNPLSEETFLTAVCRGVIRVGHLAEEAPCQGTLEFRYVSEAKVRYRLHFSAGGADYAYIGEKTGIRPWNLVRTHATCHGALFSLETGEEVSRSRVTFRPSALPSLLKSFRVVRRGTATP